MQIQLHPKACIPTPSKIYHQTLEFLPPACLLSPPPAFFQAQLLPYDLSLLMFVSYVHTTLYQSSTIQNWCARANSILSFLHFCERRGFFSPTTAFISGLFRQWNIVWAYRDCLLILEMVLAISTAVEAFPEPIRWTA